MRYGAMGRLALLSLTVIAALTACSSSHEPAEGQGSYTAAPGQANPEEIAHVPISPAGYLGQFNLSSPAYAIANRFVPAENVTIDRWYYAINGEGADCIEGRDGYGAGNGGIEFGRIVDVNQDTGLPTGNVLGSEQINACDAQQRSASEFGLPDDHQVHFVQFKPVSLQAGKMYAFVLSNVDPHPGDGGSSPDGNHMSANLNFAKLEDMGPNGKNTLDPNAPGATYGLDPRSTTMWSDDSGATWKFGDQVGWYNDGNGQGRMWPGGYRVVGGRNIPNGWPYMNWPRDGPAEITFTAQSGVSLVRAGGASTSKDVDVITVENLDTSVTATTDHLGSGLQSGALSQPVPVAKGQRYVVRTDGAVDTGSSAFWDRVYDLNAVEGTYSSSCPACQTPLDHPMLYASP
jgi:hypothetical protein